MMGSSHPLLPAPSCALDGKELESHSDLTESNMGR